MRRIWLPTLVLGAALLVVTMLAGPRPLSLDPVRQEREEAAQASVGPTVSVSREATVVASPVATPTPGGEAPAATATTGSMGAGPATGGGQRAAGGRGDAAAIGRGMVAFTAWCNSCHPSGGEGNGPALWGGGITPSPARIRARIRAGDPREVARFAHLSDERLNDIIAYIIAQAEADRR